MKITALLALFSCLLLQSEASPRMSGFARLEADPPKVMCSLQEVMLCTNEIQSAWDDCSHIEDIATVLTCINDILGASDCQKCVCDVLSFLC